MGKNILFSLKSFNNIVFDCFCLFYFYKLVVIFWCIVVIVCKRVICGVILDWVDEVSVWKNFLCLLFNGKVLGFFLGVFEKLNKILI